MKPLSENPLIKMTDIRTATMMNEIELFNDCPALYAEMWIDETITAEANRCIYKNAIKEMDITGITFHVRRHKVYAVKDSL